MGKKKDENPEPDIVVVDETIEQEPEPKDKGANIVPDATIENIAEVHTEKHDGFNPEIHALDSEGKPLKKADGTYAKKRGRKAGSNPAGSALPSPNAPATGNAPSTLGGGLTSENAAKQICNMLLNGAVAVFGSEWEPENKDEAKALVFTFKDYFDIRGVPQFPPEIGLILGIGVYVIPRLKAEKTRTKLQLWKDNVTLWFRKRAQKKAGYG